MSKPTFDLGFTQQVSGVLRRAINKDGTFDVRPQAGWRDFHPYLYIINMSWPAFLAALFLAYFLVNTAFAFI